MRVFILLIVSEVLLFHLTCTSRVRVRRENMKVRITAMGDTIVLKFLRAEADTKLEGYILGYGSGIFSKQFIRLPEDNEHYETEIDAEPKYLIVVRPVKANEVKKKCTGKVSLEKPLHLMIGTVTPTSVLLSWGMLLKTPYTDAHLDDCVEDGEFTVRYKEKETSNKWNYETCPTTDTVIDHLKPDTPYEFEVRAETDTDTGAWSTPVTHNTAADINIDVPLKPRVQLGPQKPVMEGPRAFFPPVTILHNTTLSRQPPILRHTASPPKPRRNQGQVISRNAPPPVLMPRPLGPKVMRNVTRPEKWNSSNSSSPGRVTRPLSPTVVRPNPTVVRPNPTVVRPNPTVVRPNSTVVRPNSTVVRPNPTVVRPNSTVVRPNPTVVRPNSTMVRPNPTVIRPNPTVVRPNPKVVRPHPTVIRPRPTVVRPHPTVVRPHPTVLRNGTRPMKTDSRNSSSPGLVTRPLNPTAVRPLVSTVAWNGTRPGKMDSRNSPGLLARPLSPAVVRNGTPPDRGAPGSINNTKRIPTVKVPSGVKHQGPKPSRPRKHFGPPANPQAPVSKKKRPNQVEQSTGKGKIPDLKEVERLPVLKPQAPPSTENNIYQTSTPTTMPIFTFNGSESDSEPRSVFKSVPVSNVDAVGKKRFVAPHVLYKTDKRPEEPCSVTHSLSFFPDEENEEVNVTGPPKTPPSNLTVVTVEGCPSFVILDWEKTDNETTAYEVSTKGSNGKAIAVLTTNQTHAAVENLKPQSNYQFKVTPKNELGTGPSTDPVTFSTESADPRVSDIPTGKTAIWSSFPFKADSYSECNGKQFVKRTWYRKFVGIQLCNSLRYKIYLSDSLKGKFYTIGDQTGYGEDHCQFVDSYLDGRTGGPLPPHQLPPREGYFRSVRQEPVKFGKIGGNTYINYVAWYECGVPIPGSW